MGPGAEIAPTPTETRPGGPGGFPSGVPGVVLVLLLAVAGALPYLGTLRAPFVFDDLPQIAENPIIRDLGALFDPSRAEAFGANAEQVAGFRNRWVAVLTFALNFRAGGTDVTGYHAANILVHVAAGLLLFRLSCRTLSLPRLAGTALEGRGRAVAFFAAALFLVHPVQTQAVTYVVQRMASLAAALCLLSLAAWAESRVRPPGLPRAAFYVLSLLSLAAAMKTKESAATFPLVILLYEALFLAGPLLGRIVSLLPHLATAAIVPASVLLGSGPSGSLLEAASRVRAGSDLSRFEYLCTQLRVLPSYLRLLVLPAGQNLDHDVRVARSLFEPDVILSLLLLLSIAALAVRLALRPPRSEPAWRLVGFGIAWFFVALSVESGLVPIADLMVEHRLYLPSAGLSLASVAALHLACGRSRDRALAVALTAAVLALGAATVLRNRVWNDPLTLWRDAAAKSPARARTRFNYGDHLRRSGDLDGARREWEAALAADPGSTEALNGLGGIALVSGDLWSARARYLEAVTRQPANAEAHFNLATVAERLGGRREAADHYRRFIELAPRGLAAPLARARERLASLEASGPSAAPAEPGRPGGADGYHTRDGDREPRKD